MDDFDLLFYRRKKMYVADFSPWIQNSNESNLIMMNAEDREHLYTRKKVRKTLEAKRKLCIWHKMAILLG